MTTRDPQPVKWMRIRLLFITLTMIGLLGVVCYKAFELNESEGKKLQDLAAQQYLRQITLAPRRGTISDRHGTPLALSLEVDSVFANPREIGSRARVVSQKLARALGVPRRTIAKKLKRRQYFAWIKRRVSPKVAQRVRDLHIPGIYLTKETRRFYPNHGLGSTIVGIAGIDGKGLEGVELVFDKMLKGKPTQIEGLHDALGRPIFNRGLEKKPAPGHDIQLTLDKFIQYETEQAISEVYPTVMPKTGWVAAVVYDPKHGDILSMASVPSYDPNHFQKTKPSQRRNRAISDTFEPGSTMKGFTMAAALEEGLVQPEDVIDCEKGRWRVGHYTIHDTHPHAKLDVEGILVKSSNIGISKIGMKLGREKLYQALRRFGFARQTEVSLAGEGSGLLRSPERWSDVGLANISFGQGVSVTVLQLVRAYGAFANGGVMMQPRILLGIRNAEGNIVQDIPPRGKRVIPPWVAETMLKMLSKVTERGGTGEKARLEDYTVAGKTGTAQKVDPVTRTYSTDLWLSSFIGIVPATDPRLVIAVVVNEPAGDKHYGGEVAGPVFKRIAQKALAYLGVQPDRSKPKKPESLEPPPPVASAEGYLETSQPLPEETGLGDAVVVPDFTGMSLTEVLRIAEKRKLKVRLLGSGRAVAQSPGPGPTSRETLCRISFRPPG